jgi:hypothetical protein
VVAGFATNVKKAPQNSTFMVQSSSRLPNLGAVHRRILANRLIFLGCEFGMVPALPPRSATPWAERGQ